MHEVSVAQELLSQIIAQKPRDAKRARFVSISVGALSGVDCEALRTAFDLIEKPRAFEHVRLKIREVPITIHCAHCDKDIELHDSFILRCPDCAMRATVVTSGTELLLHTVQWET